MNDLETIDRLTADLYAAISFEAAGMPDLEQLQRLFWPPGLLINNNEEQPVVWDVAAFIAVYRNQIESGTVISFVERELVGRTDLFGGVAQRFSTYEARFRTPDGEFPVRGINSIQYLQTGQTWRVVSILWNDETEGRPIPEKYY